MRKAPDTQGRVVALYPSQRPETLAVRPVDGEFSIGLLCILCQVADA